MWDQTWQAHVLSSYMALFRESVKLANPWPYLHMRQLSVDAVPHVHTLGHATRPLDFPFFKFFLLDHY